MICESEGLKDVPHCAAERRQRPVQVLVPLAQLTSPAPLAIQNLRCRRCRAAGFEPGEELPARVAHLRLGMYALKFRNFGVSRFLGLGDHFVPAR